MDSYRASSGSGKLPAGLAGVLNHPEEHRDSAYFSSADGLSTKHNSTMSSTGALLTPSSGYTSPAADTSSPMSVPFMSATVSSPPGSMTVASMVSPTASHPDQAMLQRLNSNRQSYESGPTSAPLPGHGEGLARRESVDSRLGHNFNGLQLSGSPYASKNQSTTSIQGTLQQQRHPGVANDRNSASRWSNSSNYLPPVLSPKSASFKIAPTITGPTISNIARAAEPTKGQAWAFPESDRLCDDGYNRTGQSFLLDSRRSSIADSIASSHLTTESKYPAGQRKLEDGMPHDVRRSSRASSEFTSTHHHSFQNRQQLGDMQSEEGDSPGAGQPYSRTPELRVSHKLAERKRRTEMKELFETLRDLMPQERGSKASKWEILTKAIAEHQRLTDIIDKLDRALHLSQKENESTRRDNTALRNENAQLRSQIQEAGKGTSAFQSNSAPAHNPSRHEGFGGDAYRSSRPDPASSRPELPPIRMEAMSGDSMSGVQYTNGFGERRY